VQMLQLAKRNIAKKEISLQVAQEHGHL